MSNYWKAQKREGTKEIFPSLSTVQKPGGGRFIKPGTKTGAKSVSKWKADAAKAKLEAAKAKLESAKFNLKQTFKKTDKELGKLKKTTDKIKWYTKDANKKRYSDDFYKGKK